MNEPFKFDFDKAEKEIKKEKLQKSDTESLNVFFGISLKRAK